MSTPYSFMDALTSRQRDVFGAISVGEDGGHNPRILAVLEARGLIVGQKVLLDGSHPPVWVTRWEVPVPVHMAWAQWCANQPDEGTPR